MVDIAKKVNKKNELMNPGERCVAAAVIMKAGQFKKTVTAGALGGVVGHLAAAAMNKGDTEVEEGTMADAFPQRRQAILALTDQRWIVFEPSAMSGGPKAIDTTIALDDITTVEMEKAKVMNTLTLHFADGSSVSMETPRANKPQGLVDAAAKR